MTSRPLRIALISEHASPLATIGSVDAGGQNIYVLNVAKCLAREGHQVDVLTRRDDAALPTIVDVRPGMRVVNLGAGLATFVQGRMEFGPRSLGARSILASPIDPQMQARLNDLKEREDFRPVAPAIPHEDLAAWFGPAAANGGASPFMLFVYDVLPGQVARIPSACHTDRTARVQTVHVDTNPRFHALLKAFGERTGVPVLVNTPFNVRGESIACTPRNAIEAFYSTPLDALVIGSFIVEKSP